MACFLFFFLFHIYNIYIFFLKYNFARFARISADRTKVQLMSIGSFNCDFFFSEFPVHKIADVRRVIFYFFFGQKMRSIRVEDASSSC